MNVNNVGNNNTNFRAIMSRSNVILVRENLLEKMKQSKNINEINKLKEKAITFEKFLKDIKQDKKENDVMIVSFPYFYSDESKSFSLQLIPPDYSLRKALPVKFERERSYSANLEDDVINSIELMFTPENATKIKNIEQETINLSNTKNSAISFVKKLFKNKN